MFGNLNGIDPYVFDLLKVARQQYPFNRDANQELVADVARQDYRSTLAKTKVPTLLVTANQSPFYRGKYAQVAKDNPVISHVAINQGGHVIMAEKVGAFNQVVEDFLKKLN
ncbi:alpha/beta fold hydrolase [Limosilactobacillus fermentum]|uniref:alpha/beta fold hydrolase n=1 Tax=Limosilactobacillus fermentum TaxID=1613 RepID=UPI0024121E5E|nr:alpha/beta hydrolase [Limosilactobacillus fermentum]